MTALEAVATYVPDGREPIEDLAGKFGLTPMQVKLFQRYHGLADVPREPEGTLLDLLLAAARRLAPLAGRESSVRYVLHARSMPVVAPFPVNALHELCRLLGLGHALAFTVTHHACATGPLAIDIAGRLLAADGDPAALALVLAGEKAFTADAQVLPETSVFGEAAAACLVGSNGQRDRLLAYSSTVRGGYDGRLDRSPELMSRFQQEFPGALAEVILAVTAKAGLRLNDISLLLPHNVNVAIWRLLCRLIGFPADRVLLDNVPVTAHAFCADLFLNYQTATERGLLREGDRYLVAAAGAGATFSAMIFEH